MAPALRHVMWLVGAVVAALCAFAWGWVPLGILAGMALRGAIDGLASAFWDSLRPSTRPERRLAHRVERAARIANAQLLGGP